MLSLRTRYGIAVACVATMALGSGTARAFTLTVNSTSDVSGNDGACTLREAIIAANTNVASGALAGECIAGVAGLDTIAFAIAGGGVHTLTPASFLPPITQAVTIDGYTQPLASPNTNPLDAGINAVLLIEVNLTSGIGFTINAAGTTIRGLVLNRGNNEISVGASNATIAGNFIGTNPAGTLAMPGPSSTSAIRITAGDDTLIGGPNAADRNLLSGDTGGSVQVQTGDGAVIQGNYIGPDVTGTASLNATGSRVGVYVLGGLFFDTTNTVIADNLISANRGGGIDSLSPGGGLIQGNLIGTQRDGVSALGNGNFGGILLRNTGGGFSIGGTGLGDGNTIAFNDVQGIGINASTFGSAILGNAIFSNSGGSNAGLGINLNGTFFGNPLANDACDAAPSVGNHGQNYPVITSAPVAAGSVTISGTLNSTPGATFRVELFANAGCDPLGNGEGQTFLGFADVTTDVMTCNATFGPLSFPVPPGQAVFTATATDAGNDTSEFSACFPLAGPGATATPALTPNPTVTPTPSGLEVCDNCIDDDGDSLVDRADDECPARADGGDLGLGDPKGRGKAVGKCGKAIVKNAQKLAATKLKLLEACTRLAYTCVQVKPAVAACSQKAQQSCAKGLAKLGAARAKLAAGVRAACGEPKLAFADLTADTGLGFGREAGVCAARGVATLASVDDVASCVAAIQECRAEAMLGYERPRAAELLVLAGRVPATDAPCLGSGADGSGAGLPAPGGKRVAKCAQTLAKAGTKFANGEIKLVQACAAAVAKCVQEKPADPKCVPKARRTCGKQLAKLIAPAKGLSAKLAAAVAKSCGVPALGASDLTDVTGLGYGALAADCASLGVAAIDNVAGIAACIQRQHACRVEQMLESRTPRLRELLDLGQVPLP